MANIQCTQGQATAQIEGLNQQIQQLTQQNEDYKNRIIAVTQAINQATQNLGQLTNVNIDAKNSQQITSAIETIEQSIKNISMALDSQQPQQIQQQQIQQQQIQQQQIQQQEQIQQSQRKQWSNQYPPSVMDPNTTLSLFGVQNFKLGNLMNGLKEKSLENQKPFKQGYQDRFAQALNEIQDAKTPQAIQSILQSKQIKYNRQQGYYGGKKTKKNKKNKKTKKQKGGFRYNLNSRRKVLSSTKVTKTSRH